MAKVPAVQQVEHDTEMTVYRVICSCQLAPFYEGENYVAANRTLHGLKKVIADLNEQGVKGHELRRQRAVIKWEDM